MCSPDGIMSSILIILAGLACVGQLMSCDFTEKPFSDSGLDYCSIVVYWMALDFTGVPNKMSVYLVLIHTDTLDEVYIIAMLVNPELCVLYTSSHPHHTLCAGKCP